MDHFLDYVFLFALMFGYIMIFHGHILLIFTLYFIFTAVMVSSFLSFGVTNELHISYFGIGPTELRILFIIFNILVIYFGSYYIASFLLYILVVSFAVLCVLIYKVQRNLWKLDMQIKKKNIKNKYDGK